MNTNKNTSKLSLIASMFIFGTIGIFRNCIPNFPSSVLAMARGFIGTLFLLFWVFVTKNKPNRKNILNNLWLLFLSGALIGFNWIFLFEAYRYTTVATATLCYYMAPVIVVLVSPLFFKIKLTLKKVICVMLAVLGMVFVSGVLKTGGLNFSEIKGILFGLGAAVLYASVIMMNKKLKAISAYDKTIIQLGSAAIVLLPYTLLTENYSEIVFSPQTVIIITVMGIIHTGISYTLYFGSISNLNIHTVAIYSYIDPIVAIILSALVLHEGMGIPEISGAILILGSTMLSEISE